jgi:hypothetical protein
MAIIHATSRLRMGETPTDRLLGLRRQLRSWHKAEEPLDDEVINKALKLAENDIEQTLDQTELQLQFPTERVDYDPIPYNLVRRVMRVLRPTNSDIFYDVGAGYGRFLFYGALACASRKSRNV